MNYCGNCFKEYPESGPCPHCGHNPAEDAEKFPQALSPGTVLGGRYIAGRPLGQGGFGITYKAMDYDTQQLVAIKEFMPSSIVFRDSSQRISVHSKLMLEDFNRAKADFLSEAKTLSQFNGLDNICDIYSYFEENGTAYFAMEYADGMPLDSYVKKQGKPLSFEQARDILLPVMEALGHVHEKGIVHRDISPDNIILRPDGRAMLIDFGAARYSAGEKTKSLTVVLKHGFAPKEQYTRRGKQGPFTDVYALAATMYWLICGKVPPEAIDRFTNDELLPPSKLGIKIPPKAERALLKALAVDENQRYRSMKDFAAALRPAAAKPKPEPKKKPEPKPKPKSRRGILIAAVCAVIALVCVAVFGLKSFSTSSTPQTTLPAASSPWELDDNGTLYINDMAYYASEKDVPWSDQRGKIKAVVISDNVSQIRNYAFYCCTSLESITIPNSVKLIGNSAFNNCSALESVTIPDSVKTICKDAFHRCTKLKSVTIPDSVTQIGDHAFAGCSSLESLVIPDSVTEIKDYAFFGCSNLHDVYYGGSQEQWNKIFFGSENTKLTSAKITFGGAASTSQTAAPSATLRPAAASNPWEIDAYDTLYINDQMADYSSAKDVPWYEQRDNVKAVVISDKVSEISNYAFFDCSSLQAVTIPNSVNTIGTAAFSGCTSLRSISIPASVTKISSYAFLGCGNLHDVYYGGSQEQWNKIFFGFENTKLTSAKISFVSTASTS